MKKLLLIEAYNDEENKQYDKEVEIPSNYEKMTFCQKMDWAEEQAQQFADETGNDRQYTSFRIIVK